MEETFQGVNEEERDVHLPAAIVRRVRERKKATMM